MICEALVLAGGLGTRLRGVVSDRQKVVARVLDRPFLSFLLARLEAAGVRHAVLCTGHLGETVAALGDAFGRMRLSYSREDVPLGTGGAARKALPLTTAESVLVLNGDSLALADLSALAAAHEARPAGESVTILAARVEDASRFGRLDLDAAGAVEGFREKGEGGPGFVNAGVYVVDRGVLAGLPEGRTVSLERETFPALSGTRLFAHRVDDPFLDIGTPESYAEAERFLAKAVRPWDGRRFLALDRDGTLLVEKHYLSDPAEVELTAGAGPALRALAEAGWGILLVTNQSGVARGYFDLATLDAIHARVRELLAESGVVLDGIVQCPHHPDERCGCRKPATGMLRKAAHEMGFDPSRGIVIGDNVADVELGRNMGMRSTLVLTGHGRRALEQQSARPDAVASNLAEAVRRILAGEIRPRDGDEEST